jgi:hypothetical protein
VSKLTSDALLHLLQSPNEMDRNGETANVVDGLFAIARGLHDVADALRERKPESVPPVPDVRPGDFRL